MSTGGSQLKAIARKETASSAQQ